MAELSLACVSLLFQAFSGCVQGYELITDARHMPADCQYLRVRMKFEQQRLVVWAELIQINYTDDELIFNSTTKGQILDILEQQRKLLHQFGRMDAKYKKLSKPLLMEIEEDITTVDSNHLLENGISGPERRESDLTRFPEANKLIKMSLEFTKKFKEVPKRLKWATWDKTKLEMLITKCSAFNDKMVEALTQSQLQDLRMRQERTNYQIMQLNSSVKSLVQIYRSQELTQHLGRGQRRHPHGHVMAITEDENYDSDSTFDFSASSSASSPNETLAALAKTKALNYAIEDQRELTDEFTKSISLRRSPSNIRDAELSFSDIKLLDNVGDEIGESHRTEALFIHKNPGSLYSKKISVWVEWKTYEHTTFHPSGLDPKIGERVKKLSALLKENNKRNHHLQFRAPHCIGYFQDEEEGRFGLVFEKPDSCHASTKPISLHTLLTDTNIPMPSLTDRIKLMRLLAETIERLHAVDWLHKGLRSANILFFADGGPTEINYADPYISGFDYSRPAMSDDMTEKPPDNAASDVYRHPVVQNLGNRGAFRKSYDLYSLGVILLEIAFWQPIERILDIDLAKARPSVTFKVRERLLSEPRWRAHVKGYLGDTVEQVVWACLIGPTAFGLEEGCDEKKVEVGAELQSKFYEKVVSGLAGMRV